MDDLTTIKGVGDATAKRLADAGITSFDQLKAVDPKNPPFVLTGRIDWEYLVGEVTEFVAEKPKTQEQTGTAREAPSTEGGTPAIAPDVGTQSAAPHQEEAGAAPAEPVSSITPTPSKVLVEIGSTITVTGPRRGRWRAGRHFGPTPETIPVADLRDDQIGAIMSDPALTSAITE